MWERKFRVKIKDDSGVYKVWSIDWLWQKALVSRACGDEYVKFDRIEALMQYTGLKDCNGVKIFEGDVVRWEWLHAESIAVVKWDYERAMFHAGDRKEILLSKVEVIGNIYENPELLEK